MLLRTTDPIQSVSEITRSIKLILESGLAFVTVRGEISNLRRPLSGHLYFTLKDDAAQMRAVLFKPQQRYLEEEPREGQEVVCSGRISLYEARGEVQIVVDVLDTKGRGTQRAAFEQLKKKLAAEGLFDPTRRRPLPFLPGRIGLVTSPGSAAMHDFLTIARQRCPLVPIEVYGVTVQGAHAAAEMRSVIDLALARGTADLLVLCRGGGSAEDLGPFNDEALVRAIAACPMPVVTAIGHETDSTLADFAADLRVPTPTAAAEAVLPDQEALRRRVASLANGMSLRVQRSIHTAHERIATLARLLRDPTTRVRVHRLRLDHSLHRLVHSIRQRIGTRQHALHQGLLRLQGQDPSRAVESRRHDLGLALHRLAAGMERRLQSWTARLGTAAARLQAVSPLAILGRGYAIVRTVDGRSLRSSAILRPGDELDVTLHEGGARCQVMEVILPSGRSPVPGVDRSGEKA